MKSLLMILLLCSSLAEALSFDETTLASKAYFDLYEIINQSRPKPGETKIQIKPGCQLPFIFYAQAFLQIHYKKNKDVIENYDQLKAVDVLQDELKMIIEIAESYLSPLPLEPISLNAKEIFNSQPQPFAEMLEKFRGHFFEQIRSVQLQERESAFDKNSVTLKISYALREGETWHQRIIFDWSLGKITVESKIERVDLGGSVLQTLDIDLLGSEEPMVALIQQGFEFAGHRFYKNSPKTNEFPLLRIQQINQAAQACL